MMIVHNGKQPKWQQCWQNYFYVPNQNLNKAKGRRKKNRKERIIRKWPENVIMFKNKFGITVNKKWKLKVLDDNIIALLLILKIWITDYNRISVWDLQSMRLNPLMNLIRWCWCKQHCLYPYTVSYLGKTTTGSYFSS